MSNVLYSTNISLLYIEAKLYNVASIKQFNTMVNYSSTLVLWRWLCVWFFFNSFLVNQHCMKPLIAKWFIFYRTVLITWGIYSKNGEQGRLNRTLHVRENLGIASSTSFVPLISNISIREHVKVLFSVPLISNISICEHVKLLFLRGEPLWCLNLEALSGTFQ